MSPDNMTAFILWDAHDDCLSSAEREVSHRCAQLSRACCASACFTPTEAGQISVELLARQGSPERSMNPGSSRTFKLVHAWGPYTSSDELASPWLMQPGHACCLCACSTPHLCILAGRMSQLRRDMGRILGMRRTPRLEFRLDRLTLEQQAMEAAFERLRKDD